MLNRTMLLIFTFAVMLAPAAVAGHDDYRYDRPSRVVILADELVDATRHLNRDVDRRSRGRWDRNGSLVQAVDRLDRRARQFRRDARDGASFRHLDRELERVLIAFDRVDRRMNYVRSGRLHRDFLRVENSVRRLARRVQIADGPRYRDRRDRRDGLRGGVVIERDRRGGVHGSIVIGDDRRRARIRF